MLVKPLSHFHHERRRRPQLCRRGIWAKFRESKQLPELNANWPIWPTETTMAHVKYPVVTINFLKNGLLLQMPDEVRFQIRHPVKARPNEWSQWVSSAIYWPIEVAPTAEMHEQISQQQKIKITPGSLKVSCFFKDSFFLLRLNFMEFWHTTLLRMFEQGNAFGNEQNSVQKIEKQFKKFLKSTQSN